MGAQQVIIADGMWMGGPLGMVIEIINPRWWRVDRWFVWAFLHEGRVEVMGRPYRIRQRRPPTPPQEPEPAW